jgi:hypothetical protein
MLTFAARVPQVVSHVQRKICVFWLCERFLPLELPAGFSFGHANCETVFCRQSRIAFRKTAMLLSFEWLYQDNPRNISDFERQICDAQSDENSTRQL